MLRDDSQAFQTLALFDFVLVLFSGRLFPLDGKHGCQGPEFSPLVNLRWKRTSPSSQTPEWI